MRTMFLIDKLILYALCLFIYSIQEIRVEVLIVSVICIGLITYHDTGYIKFIVISVYAILALKFTTLMFFMPAMVYGVYEDKYFFWPIICLLPSFFLNQSNGFYVIILGLLAIWIKRKSKSLLATNKKLMKLSDEKRELEHNSKLKTKMLIEKQDNEIHLATLNERNRIAREIHDHVGHQLSSAILQVGALKIALPNHKGLETLNYTLGTAMNQIRASVHNLYETSIELDTQIESILNQFDFCKTTFKHNIQTPPTPTIKYTFIAIVKEALSNVIKHSNASIVDIILVEHPAFYQLTISDNGNSFPKNKSQGIGLHSIEQRAIALNGQFRIRSSKGFELFITIPKE